MRQHPIPQNILDIEFKLFTKFTVREFAYLAVGIGFGGIFLYLFSTKAIPGVVALPIFVLSSAVGIFLGVVKVNDQPADIFMRNYFWAITHPTQRVWKNSIIDQKVDQLIKPTFNVGKANQEATKGRIIGGENSSTSHQFIEQNKIEQIDAEEREGLEEFSKLAGAPAQKVITPQANSQPSPISQPVQPARLILTKDNFQNYIAQMSDQQLRGNLNFKVVDKQGNPIPESIVVIKDSENRVVSAMRSNNLGEVYSDRIFPSSIYILDVQAKNRRFPAIQIAVEDKPLNPIKISEI